MWKRWKKRESLLQIAQLFNRDHGSVRGILVQTDGIPPAQRCCSPIACQLGRAPSTNSREIQRNGGQGNYRAAQADQAA